MTGGAGHGTGLARTFLGTFLSLTLLLAAVSAVHYFADYRSERTRRESSEALNVELARRALASDIAAVVTDLLFLARHLESLSFDPVADFERRRYLEAVFTTFIREKGLYDQIRFIDPGGRETVRVNFNAGAPRLVDAAALQDKSSRYYVRRAMALTDGQVYISPLDLNMEDGRIEVPHKPVMRFATPVVDRQGRRQGLVVLNYLGERLLERFMRASAEVLDHLELLNGAGYWLRSAGTEQPWGFMYGRTQTYGGRFPTSWPKLRDEQAGQFVAEGALVTFASVQPALEAARVLTPGSIPVRLGEQWKVVARLPLSALAPNPRQFLLRYAGLYLSLLCLLGLVAYLLASAHIQRRAAEAERAHERRFRQTLEDIGLAAVMVDPHWRVVFCNRFLLDLTGWSMSEVVGSDWVERFVPAEQRAQVRGVLARIDADAGVPEEFEADVQTRNRGQRLMAWNTTLTCDAQGHAMGLTAIGQDVTERRHAELEVKKLLQAVEQSPSIVMITDRAGRIEYVNRKFTEVTGLRLRRGLRAESAHLKVRRDAV